MTVCNSGTGIDYNPASDGHREQVKNELSHRSSGKSNITTPFRSGWPRNGLTPAERPFAGVPECVLAPLLPGAPR